MADRITSYFFCLIITKTNKQAIAKKLDKNPLKIGLKCFILFNYHQAWTTEISIYSVLPQGQGRHDSAS